jgi:Helix-turn-helix family
MKETDFWPLIESTTYAFGPFYQSEMGEAIEATGAPNLWGPLNLARGAEPEPFSLNRYADLDPYTNPGRLIEILDELASLELLARVSDSVYTLTGTGRETVKAIFEAAHRSLSGIAPLPAAEMDETCSLLEGLVQTALDSPEPEQKWSLRYSRWTDPGKGSSPAARIDQYLTDLLRYRDDCHLDSWRKYGVSGPAWETLTMIWREQASSISDLADALSNRSYTADDYSRSVRELVERGWLLETENGLSLTGEGEAIRIAAEEETGRLFNLPFLSLGTDKAARLDSLLRRLNQTLEEQGNLQIWEIMPSVSTGIYKATREALAPVIADLGLDKPGMLFILMRAKQFDPRPVSASAIDQLNPYFKPVRHARFLEEVAQAGFLESIGDGEYSLTSSGRAALDRVNESFYLLLGALPVSSSERTADLERFLNRLVQASVGATEPTNKERLVLTYNTHPEKEYSDLARIDQHLDDLLAYRDDAHLAAWRSHGISPQAWEAFTLVWRAEAGNASELAEKLRFREYGEATYLDALQSLVSRGWLREVNGLYEVTESGKAVRQSAEDETNRIFFTPWKTLERQEINHFRSVLLTLERDLQELEAAQVAM